MTTEPLHTLAETAKTLGISVKTLREHVNLGRIRSIIVGSGTKRKTRRFTDQNIASFIEKQKVRETPACQSSKAPKAPSTNTTSKSTVVDFMALQKPKTKKTLMP
ncbi:helix-turn-helix domain-containing protein [Antarcticirhabdus aurantiaca]|uniref:Helix-turn-helix domain-containing protein n=1 Tax=Antarcticirhabdus aurantiaca TaxID=2606717 RepID=A0ACD4NHK4_9HYPH|nr:helix-turn-helix domain-containing protein [Jeongeuplla avenae]